MEHPFFTPATTPVEALRWLTIAEKLLSARDLMGSKSFATRARDSDPTLTAADEILAVVDTLLAGDRRIGSNQLDWYGILRITPQQGGDSELIANQYRRLVLLLNPQKNKFPFADQAFRLVVDAWSVLSNVSRKSMYDNELAFYLQPQQHQTGLFNDPVPALHQNFIFFGGAAAAAASVSQPQVHGAGGSGSGAVQFAQVHQVNALPQVDPVVGAPTLEPRNFMNVPSGSNIFFGSGSVFASKSSDEPVNNQAQESYSIIGSNVASASEATQEQVMLEQNQPYQSYSSVSDKSMNKVNVSQNVGETREDEEDVREDDGDVREVVEDVERMEVKDGVDASPANDGKSTFWTACPYCYYVYEYPSMYIDCTMKCQNCRKAFQAVVIPSPPASMDGQEGYFCCWGFLPLGFSMENWEKHKGAASTWTPFSPMLAGPQGGDSINKDVGSAPRVFVDDDEVFIEISSSESDDDWYDDKAKRKKSGLRNVKRKGASRMSTRSAKRALADKGKNVNVQGDLKSPDRVEMPDKTTCDPSTTGVAANARKKSGRAANNFGKLDLNVEFSNEAEEPAPRENQPDGLGRGEDDNIEGNGFFEGLDEFLSSLPILNVAGDGKAVKAA